MLEDNFSDIIGKARYGKGWSLPDLARRAGLSAPRIEALEEGSAPSGAEIALLASALELHPQKLTTIAEGKWEPVCAPMEWPGLVVRRIDGRIGSYPVNGYLAIDPARKEAALFDTGYSPDRVTRLLAQEELRLVALCITHAHPDHIGGAERIRSATGAPIYLHPNELPGEKKTLEVVPTKEGGVISVGGFEIHPLFTPGHTPGGTSFLIDRSPDVPSPIVFVGDALFAGSLGRARSSSTYPVLLHSVQTVLLSLPEETRLFPGHGPATTVGEERMRNPFF